MEEESKTNPESTPEKKSEVNLNISNSSSGIIIAIVISVLIGIAGIILGATGLVKAEQALKILKSNDIIEETVNEENPDEEAIINYGEDEAEIEEVDFITLSHNGGKDFIDIYTSGIDYYSFNQRGEAVFSEEIETDTKSIMDYIFSNDILQYLKEDGEVVEGATWSIEAENVDGMYVASGKDAEPEWFTAILEKVNQK